MKGKKVLSVVMVLAIVLSVFSFSSVFVYAKEKNASAGKLVTSGTDERTATVRILDEYCWKDVGKLEYTIK